MHLAKKIIINRFNDFVSNLTKKEGFINYYWDESKGKIYIEIEKLGQELIYVNYLSAGLGSNDIGLDRAKLEEHGLSSL